MMKSALLRSRVGRLVRFAAGAAAVAVAAGCGSATTTTTRVPRVSTGFNVTSCGIPYTFRVGARTVRSGSCAGILGRRPPRVTLRTGQQLSLEIEHDLAGNLYYPVPSPEGSSVRLVSRSGPKVVYQAVSSGASTLLAKGTRYCLATDPEVGTCPALAVRVVR